MTLNVPQNTFRFLLNRIWGSMWKTIKGLSVLPLGNKHINLWYSVNRQLLGKNHESVCDVLGGYSFHTDKSLCSTWKLLWKENNRLIHWDSDSTAQSPPSDLTEASWCDGLKAAATGGRHTKTAETCDGHHYTVQTGLHIYYYKYVCTNVDSALFWELIDKKWRCVCVCASSQTFIPQMWLFFW